MRLTSTSSQKCLQMKNMNLITKLLILNISLALQNGNQRLQPESPNGCAACHLVFAVDENAVGAILCLHSLCTLRRKM